MAEFEVNGVKYKARKVDIFNQLKLAKRVAPAIVALGSGAIKDGDLAAVAAPVMNAVSVMPDSDLDYIAKTCLAVVERQDGQGWSKVMAPGGGLMFEDIELPTMLQIVWNVLMDSLGSFFVAKP